MTFESVCQVSSIACLYCFQYVTVMERVRTYRESVLFIGTPFSNLYTAVDTPAMGRVV
jgi:hypothetical protein